MENRYDVVIIGSGLGGLECGVILSKEGYNVCVLEQSAVYGGCLQSFTRKGRTIDTGIHYVGSMDTGQIMRQYLKYFGIWDELSVVKLDSDFDVITFENSGTFSYVSGYESFAAHLTEQFPAEKLGIERYCNRIREIGSSISIQVHQSGMLSSGATDNLSVSASEFIADCVSDATLRNVLSGTNLLYGGIREASNLYHHAMINHSNIEGAFRFVGGTQRVADLLVQQIIKNGGTVRNRSQVVGINVESAEVQFVELSDGERIYAKRFISNLHPKNTFKLISDTPAIKRAYRTRLDILPNTYGLFSVYLLMKPNSFPYLNKNLYYFHSGDAWDSLLDAQTLQPKSIMLSTQLASKGAQYTDVVTIMAPICSSVFSEPTDGYSQLKEQIAHNIIEFAARYHPQLRSSIEHIYTASPLTYERYTGTPQGSAYGILKDYRSTIATMFPARTKISNLLLTGQNLNVHGAIGVTITAAATCAELLGTEYLTKKIGKL